MVDCRHFNCIPTMSSYTQQVTTDFHFALPRSTSLPGDGSSLAGNGAALASNHWGFPPSLETESSMISDLQNSGSKGGAVVSYEVKARLFYGRALIASTVRGIRVFDSTAPAPPICTADFSPEYVCEQVKSLKKNLFTKLGTLSIVTGEPKPLEFQSSQGQATTQLSISIVLRIPDGHSDAGLPSGLVSDITWCLKASTFIMMKETAALPTVQQASTSPFVTKSTSRGQRRGLKLRWPQWEEAPLCTDRPNEKVWKTKHDLVLSIPSSCLPAPTFCTPYLVRRYSISLRMNVKGAGRAEARFNVPVQVIYRSPTVASSSPRFPIPLDSDLPIYIAPASVTVRPVEREGERSSTTI